MRLRYVNLPFDFSGVDSDGNIVSLILRPGKKINGTFSNVAGNRQYATLTVAGNSYFGVCIKDFTLEDGTALKVGH